MKMQPIRAADHLQNQFSETEAPICMDSLDKRLNLNMRDSQKSITDHAIPSPKVSAFCRAVMLHLIPHEFWGSEDTQTHNRKIFHNNVDQFIRRRRFETLSLHEATQGLKVV